MTITLTIEQLRAYQNEMEAWTRGAMAAEAVKNANVHAEDIRFSSSPLAGLRVITEKWMAEHPMPKLVPKELEA